MTRASNGDKNAVAHQRFEFMDWAEGIVHARSLVPQSRYFQRLGIRLGMLVEGMAAAEKEGSTEAEVMTAVDSARARAVEEGLVALAVGMVENLAVPAEKVGLAVVGVAGAGSKDSQAATEEKVAAMERKLPERKPPRVAPMQGASSRRAEGSVRPSGTTLWER